MRTTWLLLLIAFSHSPLAIMHPPLRSIGGALRPAAAHVRLPNMADGHGARTGSDSGDADAGLKQAGTTNLTNAAAPPARAAALATFAIVTSVMPFCWSVWANPFFLGTPPFRPWLVFVCMAYALLLDTVSDVDSAAGGTLRRAGVTKEVIQIFEAQQKLGYAILLPFMLVGFAGLPQWLSTFWNTAPASNSIWSIIPPPVWNYVAAPAYFLAVFADRAIERVPSPKRKNATRAQKKPNDVVMRIRGGRALFGLSSYGRQTQKHVLAVWRLWGMLSVPASLAYAFMLARNEGAVQGAQLIFKGVMEVWEASKHPPKELFVLLRDCFLICMGTGPVITLTCIAFKLPRNRPIPMSSFLPIQRDFLWSIIPDLLKTPRTSLWPAIRNFSGCFMAIALQTEMIMRFPNAKSCLLTVFTACTFLVSLSHLAARGQ